MIIGRNRFNIYLLLAFTAALTFGCRSTKKEEVPLSTVRIHQEVTASPMDFSVSVPVYRAQPVTVTVDKDPFLTEANVASAKVVDVLGGFNLQLEFDHRGALLLEQYTASNPGRRLGIFSMFGDTKVESRWLAAPVISRRIGNGVLSFAPDASRAEAERVALGLNNVAKRNKEKSKW